MSDGRKKVDIREAEWRDAVGNDFRFLRTYGVVDATHEEQHRLWWEYSEHYRMPWKQDGRGWMGTIGELAGHPVTVCVFWVEIGMIRIAFLEGTSQVVDHRLIEAWRKVVFPNAREHSDATNFGNIVVAIERHLKCELFNRRRMDLINKIIEADDLLGDATRKLLEGDPHEGFTYAERKMQEWGERARRYQELMKK